MEVYVSQIGNECEHPRIDEDSGKDWDHTCVDCGVQDDPEDDYEALFEPETD
jgi:hypothetical protein